MYYSKIILLSLMSSIFFFGCKDKKKIEPQPEEYFSFYADGEYFNYPQERNLGFGGTGQTLKAYGAGTAGYIIRGYSRKDPVARGAISFHLAGGQLPISDTVIIDGISNTAGINDFGSTSNDYTVEFPLKGKIIFSQKNNQKLIGTFEFQAGKSGGGTITITKGKFAIIPNP